MNRFWQMLRQPEFHVCMAVLFFLLICLPFLIFPEKNEAVNMFNQDMFLYFFIVWGGAVGFLFFIAKSLYGNSAEENAREDNGADV